MPVTTCPSGLQIEWREMETADEDNFAAHADEPESNQATAMDELLTNLAVRVVDKASYRFDKMDLQGVLSGDRTKLLVDVRNDAFGEEIEVSRKCGNGHLVEQVIDLRFVKMYPLTKEGKHALETGQPLSFTLPRCGRTVKWQMLTGYLESGLLESIMGDSKHSVTDGIKVRVTEVEGFDEAGLDPDTQFTMHGWLSKLHTRDSRALRQHIADTESGIEPMVKIPCKRTGCRSEVVVNILTHPDFFPLTVDRKESNDSSDS